LSKKICIIGPSELFFSGLTTHTISLANALAKNNKVSVILLKKLLPRFLYPGRKHIGKISPAVAFYPGIEVYKGMNWNSPVSWYGAYKFLIRNRPDTIIMLWWTSSVAHMELFLAIVNRLKIKSRILLEMHEIVDPMEAGILPIKLYSKIAGKLIMSRTDAFVTHSTPVKKQVAEIYGINEKHIFVVPMGLHEDYKSIVDGRTSRNKLGIEDAFVILYFGLIRKYKGVPYLIEAFNKLPRYIAEKSKLVIVGEDWGDEIPLNRIIEFSPYKKQITCRLQFIPDEMISRYFCAANVVVLPYLRTSGSGVVNIAMAYGKPIIISAISTMMESLAGYKGALFTAPGDSAAITGELTEIYNKYVAGDSLTYSPPGNTWSEVARQYEVIMEEIGV